MSPTTTSLTPIAVRVESCSACRTKARTTAPRATSALITALPVLPPAPVTRIMCIVQKAALYCRHCERSEAMTGSNPRFPSQFEQPARAERNLQELDAAAFQIECVFDRLREQRSARNGARFTGALDAKRIERRLCHGVPELHARHLEGGRQQIVCQRGIEQLPLIVEHQFLIERIADPLRDAAMNLARQNHRIDHGAAVMHDDVF